MRDKLRKWREDNCRNSEQIVDVGEELIGEHASKLGDDGKCVKTEEMSGYMIAHPSRELFLKIFLAGICTEELPTRTKWDETSCWIYAPVLSLFSDIKPETLSV